MRLRFALAATGIVAALALAGCSGGGGGNASPEEGAALTIAKPDGAITTESNNPFISNASAMTLGYANAIYEPLAMVNLVGSDTEITPWLAEKLDWNDTYTALTVTARSGVKWSDGEDFTADDIAYTFQLLKDKPQLDLTALGIKDVTEDGDTATITFDNPMYVKQDKVLHKFIVPKHIWEKVADPTTETNKDPVGTGPYVLSKFTTQSVELTARDDYWGGKLAVPTLYYVSYNDNTALTTALASGDADWAQAFIPNVQSAFIDKDPDHNVYWAAAGLGIDAMFVNTQTKPFDDVAFRKAVNMVMDREKHASIAREGGVPVLDSVTALPSPAGDSWISPEFQGKKLTVDVDGAKQVLTDAGYTWKNDKLVDPDGEAVTFELKVPQGWNDYVTGISLISDSVKALGVDASVQTPDADSWLDAIAKGDFQAILHWTDTGMTPYDLYSNIMDGRFLKPKGEVANYNFGRYDNKEATAALQAFATATDDATRKAALEKVQKIFVDDVPGMAVGTRPFIGQYNTRNYVGWPSADDPYISPDPTQPTAALILTKLKPAS
ncbi:ABC transporter substrate-binding protein [Microbacterium protaetiae]|uniref:ABC transporter substrate-binding protein n=1 Tax=Microbacterium protaetiae TaxID=2509458 RepID=A0A4P6EMB5_9MICO|nr:ABC transporter substrate-binding protein [Microbacterium protaetiae]QAY61387.1 ABC transporter substrate-binding protein [Microbacterium protaetiae]